MSDSPGRKKDHPPHLAGRMGAGTPPPMDRLTGWVSRPWRALLLMLLLCAASSGTVAAGAMIAQRLAPPPSLDNAIWLGIQWGEDEHRNDEVLDLVAQLRRHRIGTAYTWLSYLQADGTWTTAASTNMDVFVGQFKIAYPQGKLLAWVSLPTTLHDLGDADLRASIAEYCGDVVLNFGFDGLHLNAEPLPNGDENFMALLREIRQQLPDGAILSVAVPPEPLTAPQLRWDDEYKQRVALLADEIVVMAYNSGLRAPAAYEDWMMQQVVSFTTAVAPLGARTRLLFGIPSYGDEPPVHYVEVENVMTALTGIQAGLVRAGEDAALVGGVALYANWETDALEWQDFRRGWLAQE